MILKREKHRGIALCAPPIEKLKIKNLNAPAMIGSEDLELVIIVIVVFNYIPISERVKLKKHMRSLPLIRQMNRV